MRILLVDDDENLMESLAERLIHQRYAVDIAIDGSSASTYVDLFEYDLIVLDLMLPDGDGIAFCKAFRKVGYANPLMILTAKESTAQKVKALDAGADDYVVKPFDFDELCARIRALLRREHQGLPTVLSLGSLSLDPSAYETTYQNQPVRLTPKEFSMMELFLRHPHRVYSLGAIIDDLWSFEDPPGDDAVRTHIKGLRRKLQKAGAPKDLIKTVYGLGYRLNENTGWVPTNIAKLQAASAKLQAAGPKQAAYKPPLSQKLADACDRYLKAASEQVATLEAIAAATENQSDHQGLDSALHTAGCVCAHKLVGSLDTFGVTHASEIARKIETYLQAMERPMERPAQHERLRQWVRELRDRIDQATVQAIATAVQSGLPSLLIVSPDADLARRLIHCANQANLQAQAVTTPAQATALLTNAKFNLVVVDVPVSPQQQKAITPFLKTLKQDYAAPVIALGSQPSLGDRLTLIQQGVDIVSYRAAPPAQIIEAAVGALRTTTELIQVAIADDDLETLALFQTTLKPWGFNVIPFSSATALWQWLNSEQASESTVDILVLDIEMPQVSGLELCQILRADARFQDIPILFLTQHQEETIRARAYGLGADDFINKAVAPAELADRLHNQVTRICRL